MSVKSQIICLTQLKGQGQSPRAAGQGSRDVTRPRLPFASSGIMLPPTVLNSSTSD